MTGQEPEPQPEPHPEPAKMPISYRQRMEIEFRASAQKPDKLVAYLLCIGLGVFGAHRFYLGETRTGFVMLALGLTVVGLAVTALWAIVDLFRIPDIIRQRYRETVDRMVAETIAEPD